MLGEAWAARICFELPWAAAVISHAREHNNKMKQKFRILLLLCSPARGNTGGLGEAGEAWAAAVIYPRERT